MDFCDLHVIVLRFTNNCKNYIVFKGLQVISHISGCFDSVPVVETTASLIQGLWPSY